MIVAGRLRLRRGLGTTAAPRRRGQPAQGQDAQTDGLQAHARRRGDRRSAPRSRRGREGLSPFSARRHIGRNRLLALGLGLGRRDAIGGSSLFAQCEFLVRQTLADGSPRGCGDG